MPSRVRELGIVPGTLPTGPLNAITDVPGVLIGHTTIDDRADLHTGVTAIVPPGFSTGLPAAIAVGNGYGKLVGSTQVDELGLLETPILLTGTLSVFRVADALVTWLLERDPDATSMNPMVGETNERTPPAARVAMISGPIETTTNIRPVNAAAAPPTTR